MNISSSATITAQLNTNLITPKGNKPSSVESQFTQEELAQIAQLKRRDREVRAHEQAHLAAAGPYAKGGASFTYQKGPDGKNYAVGGEVQIDTSPISGDPKATIRKAEQVQRAASAPASPSGQDRSVAADAASTAVKARIALAKKEQEETSHNAINNQSNKNHAYQKHPSPSQMIDDLI